MNLLYASAHIKHKLPATPVVKIYHIFHPFPVANVSFETTEEQLKAVLSEVGPVVSLK